MAKDEDLDKFARQMQVQIMEQIRKQYSDVVIDRWQNPRNYVPLNHPDGYARVIGKNPTGESEINSSRDGEFMRECNVEKNTQNCNCSWEPCSRKGLCCECLTYHWRNEELPACFFPDDVERTYDRSLRRFIQVYKDRV